jgi:ADP-ribosylglycohydrolase/protein-tyrosine phosphatase
MELDTAPAPHPPRPLPNSYWVVPGRLLAGEYPGGRSAVEASNRLQSLLNAGMNAFIDLTELNELPPYRDLLAESDVRDLQYHRSAFTDHGVPETVPSVVRVLDLIDELLAEGRCIYLHCRAGIGRTGLIVGCHLVRTGLAGEAALERLQVLWRQCERSRSWPSVPETEAQVRFVRTWREPSRNSELTPTLAQRCEGALLGLVIGDALGTLSGEVGRDAASFAAALAEQSPLPLGADSAMTLAVAQSLLERQGHDPKDQLQRYQEWVQSATGGQLAPAELKRALAAWKWSRKTLAGSHDPKNVDPHTLARSLAAALYGRAQPPAAIDLAMEISRTTLQSPVVLDLCRLWTAALLDSLQGEEKTVVLSFAGPLLQQVRARKLRPELDTLLSGEWTRPVGSSAQSVLAVALRSLQSTQSFKEGALRAVSAGRQRPTCGALYGAIAGALYGVQQIPAQWRARVLQEQSLLALAQRLADLEAAQPSP